MQKSNKKRLKGKKKVTFVLPEKKEERKKQLSELERSYRRNLLRTKDFFLSDYGTPYKTPQNILEFKIATKAWSEYGVRQDVKVLLSRKRPKRKTHKDGPQQKKQKVGNAGMSLSESAKQNAADTQMPVIVVENERTRPVQGPVRASEDAQALMLIPEHMRRANRDSAASSNALVLRSRVKKRIKPVWHAPWKLYKVLSGHLGWVRCVDVDVGNEFFVTGSADRTVKIWDLATGDLKLTLTGHTDHVRGVKISPRHPYLFSVGLDQTVKCWDLEQNKVIRSYHGHLSGVFCVDIHPTLDIIFTGGRDSVVRTWDIRTKKQIYCLEGHKNTIASIASQSGEPHVISGSHDQTIRCWDLKAGKSSSVLTHHKKSVRSLYCHPTEYTFGSGSGDNIKVWKCPEGRFLRNFDKRPPSITNDLVINSRNICVSGHDTGQIMFWDWKTGHCFQEVFSDPQAGSVESEAGIQALCFDQTGTRLISTETDKAIKLWREDPNATPETHPVRYKPSKKRSFY